MTWRDRAKAVIARVVRENPGVNGEALRPLLQAAYPFGERKYTPYKVWLAEVAAQTGTAKAKAAAKQDEASELFKETPR